MHVPGIIHRSELPLLPQSEVTRRLGVGTPQKILPWRVTDNAPSDLVAVLREGVRPTCLDGAALHGLWIPPGLDAVHVFRPRQGRGQRTAGRTRKEPETQTNALPIRRFDGQVRWTEETWRKDERPQLVFHGPALRAWPTTDPVPDLGMILDHAARCLPTVQAATLFESALEKRKLRMPEAQRIIAALPQRHRRALARIRADAGSGTETTVRWWLESLRVPVRAQVRIRGVGRVDMMLGHKWIIECDSRRFHDDPDQYARDRARDLRLQSYGYQVTRLTWEQVFLHWGTTKEMLLSILRRGEHLRTPERPFGLAS